MSLKTNEENKKQDEVSQTSFKMIAEELKKLTVKKKTENFRDSRVLKCY